MTTETYPSHRLDRLERSLRRTRLALAVAIAAGAVAFLAGTGQPEAGLKQAVLDVLENSVLPPMTTRELTIIGAEPSRIVATLGADEAGVPYLMLTPDDDGLSAVLRVAPTDASFGIISDLPGAHDRLFEFVAVHDAAYLRVVGAAGRATLP